MRRATKQLSDSADFRLSTLATIATLIGNFPRRLWQLSGNFPAPGENAVRFWRGFGEVSDQKAAQVLHQSQGGTGTQAPAPAPLVELPPLV